MKAVITTTETYEVFITELDWPDIDHETRGKLENRCTCVWRPMSVQLVWYRHAGTDWRIVERQIRCQQVVTEGTELGRNGKTFDFSLNPRKIPTIDEPAGLAELEEQHHPSKLD